MSSRELLVFLLFACSNPKDVSSMPQKPSVDPSQLQAHVIKLSEELGPRDYKHPENLDRVAAYIKQEFISAKGEVSEQAFTAQTKTYKNVIATFGPKTEERVIVGAHYDTCGPMPGADDNASGIAGLIELAKLLGKTPPNITVELVAYTLDEPPFFRTQKMGSAIHAQSLKAANAKVRAMLSIEMIGYFSDAPNSQNFPTFLLKPFYPSKGNFISIVGRLGQGKLTKKVRDAMAEATPLPVETLLGPRFIEGIDFSDHLNYWEEGYPAAMITDTAFFRNQNYHTAQDTADTLDYQRMSLVVLGLYAAVNELAK
jgi:Zn-dependent M28 family amino/carboxypeptidase